jgi:type IV pilus assembly protein PilM
MLILDLRDTTLQLILADHRPGSYRIKKAITVELGESLKGYVSAAENLTSLTKTIKHFTTERSVVVCLNTSTVIYRDMIVPKATPKYLATLIRHELTYALNLSPDYLLDYTVLGEVEKNGKKHHKILVTTLPAQALQDIVETLTKLDLTVTHIDAGLNAVIKYAEFTKLLHPDQSILLADISPSSVRQYLFEKGRYAFNRSTKLNPTTTPEDAILEMLDPIEKMVQFARNASTHPLDAITLFGSSPQLDHLAGELSTHLEIPTESVKAPLAVRFRTQAFDPDLVVGIGTMVSTKTKRKKDINLLISYNLFFNKQRALVDLDRMHKLLSFGFLYVGAFAFIFMNIRANLLSAQIQASKAYLNQEDIQSTLGEIEAMRNDISLIQQIKAEIDSIQTVLDRIPRLNGLQITTVLDLKPTGLRLVNIAYSNSLLSMSFETNNPTLIYPYVLTLEALENFDDVSYQSYTCTDEGCLVTLDVTLQGGFAE